MAGERGEERRSGRTFRSVAALLILVAAAGAAAWWSRTGAAVRAPDVVLVVIDTLRADRLGCYGYPRPTSPFLDSLASEGAVFEDVTCQFSWTRPSMVSLMEGRYLTAYRDAIEPDAPTLAEAFRRAGYRTLGMVANGSVSEKVGFARGFDHFDCVQLSNDPLFDDFLRDIDELCAGLWTPLDAALRPDAKGERPPLLLYLHVMDVHGPYDPYPEYDGELAAAESAPVLPEGWQLAELGARGAPRASNESTHEADVAALRRQRGYYDQGVRHTDDGLRRVFDRLGALGLLEHAVVAVVADHGEGLWEHLSPLPDPDLARLPASELFYQQHGGSQFQEVLATPMIFAGAGIRPGLRVREPVENVDLFPTLLELCDLPRPADLHGRSLAPLLTGRGDGLESAREFVYSFGVHGNTVREVATGLKLIVPRGKALAAGHSLQLYDLSRDPEERRDLAGERPDDVKRLLAEILAWQERYPTDSNLVARAAKRLKEEEAELLRGLGYTGIDVGGDE